MPVYVNGQEYEDEFQLTLGRPTQQEQSPSEGKDSYHQPDQLNLMDQAKEEFPILKNLDYGYKENFGGGQGFLEHWPVNETGTPDHPRPPEFSIDKKGLEVYRKDTRPMDIMGDVASHELVNSDPVVKGVFEDFQKSLQPWQHDILNNQYEHAKKNFGETRPFEEWKQASGLPAYFRGYPFKQWDNAESMYTPDQLASLDSLMTYLRGPTSPAEAAAKRTSEAVKPAAGRSEGGITKAIDNAVPHTVESIKNMVTFPSEYVNFMTEMSKKKELTEEDQFKINHMQDQMVKWGADTGINLGTGGVATAPMREAGVGVFGGRIGATALGKNNLLDAYKLEHIGANPTDIWFKTGWYRGTDGKFRFEIPDTNATVNLNRFQKIEKKDATPPDWTSASTDTQTHTYVFPENLKLKDIYDHPDLYKAYPHLKDVKITEIPKDSHAIADASSAENTIRLSQKAFENPDFIKTVLTHEIQHMIQAEERFAKGASYISDPKKFQTPFDSHMEIVNRDIDKIQEYLDKGGRMNPAQQEYMHKLLDIQQAFKDYKDSALKLAEVNYKRSAGEVEARTAMRRTKNPNAVDDIPPQDQLVHFKSELFAPHGLVTGIGKPR